MIRSIVYYYHLEAVSITTPKKTVTYAQTNNAWCGGSACNGCGRCRDWTYDPNVEGGRRHLDKFDIRCWRRSPSGKCFYGPHHFPPTYYHAHFDDEESLFYNRFVRNCDHATESFDNDERQFYAHFFNVCKCVRVNERVA